MEILLSISQLKYLRYIHNLLQFYISKCQSLCHFNNILQSKNHNKKIDKYEKDRIGQGAFGENVLGVGGMNAAKKAQEYLKGGDNAPQVPNIKPLNNGKKNE